MAQDTYKTYVPLQSITLTANTGVVQFGVDATSGNPQDWIPQHYIDLVVVAQGTSVNASGSGLVYRINGSSTGYSSRIIEAWSTNAPYSFHSAQSSFPVGWNGQYGTGWASSKIQIMNYANSSNYKLVIGEQAGASGADVTSGTWASTEPVKTIQFALGSTFPDDTWAIGSTFSLYGVGLKDGSP